MLARIRAVGERSTCPRARLDELGINTDGQLASAPFEDCPVSCYETLALCLRESHAAHEVDKQDNVVDDVCEVDLADAGLLLEELSDTGVDGARLESHVEDDSVVSDGVAKVLEREHHVLEALPRVQVEGHADVTDDDGFHAPVEALVERAEIAQCHDLEDSPYGNVLVGIAEMPDDVPAQGPPRGCSS